ncbi:MAG TPA: TauD/TfdA family dioxygenase [Bryobacteraceae bacterium]|nr:TauD/TfdA family dioxygenase [Bryobacteraceae bacterium]
MSTPRRGFFIEETGTIGARVTDLDLSREISDDVAEDLRQAWYEYAVLVFPKLGDTSEKHLRLSRVFGELQQHVNPAIRLPDEPELIALGAAPETKGRAVWFEGELRYGFLYFHQDSYYTPSIAKGALLRMTKLPRSGGDTVFVDLEKAYAALPDDLKQLCQQRQTIQVYREVPDPLWGMRDIKTRFATDDEADYVELDVPDWPPVVHPMVVHHPVTGRPSLLMSPAGYNGMYGMAKEQGDAFYETIASHAMQPQFSFRQQWSMDDMLLWDNRRTMHWAMGYPIGDTRIIKRSTLKGEMQTGRLLSELTPA